MIYALKKQNDHGAYVDDAGTRWDVRAARGVYGRIVEDWQQFADLESALSQWGLTPIMPTEPEIEPETEPEIEL